MENIMENITEIIQKKQINKTYKIPLFILILMLVVALIVVVIMAMQRQSISEPLEEDTTIRETEERDLEKWQEGIVEYQGKDYIYNQYIKAYLIMGIDKDGKVEAAADQNSGGQADALFLLVTNAKDKEMSIISIHRNTMTRIETYYEDGISSGYVTGQLCVQHGFGDGRHLSCSRTADAVSHLLYNTPIAGYLSVRLDAIPIVNDAVNGVEVVVLNDISYPAKAVELKEGDVVTLSGDEAYAYLRKRDIEEFDSASLRLRRQEQYILAFASKLKEIANQDLEKVVDIYNSVEDYIVTNMDFAGLVAELHEYAFSPEGMYSIPGETVMGEEFEEYYVDEKALYDLIIRVFYTEVTD